MSIQKIPITSLIKDTTFLSSYCFASLVPQFSCLLQSIPLTFPLADLSYSASPFYDLTSPFYYLATTILTGLNFIYATVTYRLTSYSPSSSHIHTFHLNQSPASITSDTYPIVIYALDVCNLEWYSCSRDQPINLQQHHLPCKLQLL